MEKVNVQPGEAVDAGKADGAVTLVVNTPLWVEMHLPTRQSEGLKVGDALSLSYADDANAKPLSGKVIFKDPIADAASGTQTVRLEIGQRPGQTRRFAGECRFRRCSHRPRRAGVESH